MIAFLRFHFLQIWRSRLLVLWFFFSLFVQYATVKLLHSATIQIQEIQQVLDLKKIVMALVYVQFFTGGVLATVYGIWSAPYLHEESRAPLTFALPLSKWVYPLAYALSFLLLVLLQLVGMFVSLSMTFGFSSWTDPSFPWAEFGTGTLLSVAALEVMVFFLSLVALIFSKVAAFIGGTLILLILQVSGVLFQAGFGEATLWRKVYAVLPPIGEFFYDTKAGMVWQSTGQHLVMFAGWLLLLAWAFRARLSRSV